ncbi:Uncharacterised protein [Legionella steigerwaltii]|uniref:Uncharacterized protein n=1 Tax=Legionella steigerwaltii TaxID=460 RepID=A0A378LAK8_9GAMM|nr:hypothetical protein [Legionella steigerwaltii]KTD80962.1 hypothetical protein Lstg_0189 [Legionella steigerwaltii]STY23350.1 Uncharacterised protein [Legionella steigerwaltii]
MKERRDRNPKRQEIERINLELQNLQEQVKTLKGTFYDTYTVQETVPDTYRFKSEIDPNAPDEFNMEPDTWKKVDKQIWVPRDPTTLERNQLDELAQGIRAKERAIGRLVDEINVAKVMETVSDVLKYLDPKKHKNDIANLKSLEEQHFSSLYDLQNHISRWSGGQSSVTRELYKAIKKSDGSDIDYQMGKVAKQLEDRVNVHKTEKTFNFNAFKEQIPRVNIDEDLDKDDSHSNSL